METDRQTNKQNGNSPIERSMSWRVRADLSQREWTEYDEENSLSLSIFEMEGRFVRK